MRAALPKILIATFGSLGDLHPFIALGQALQREGFAIVVATSSEHREAVESAGLGFTAIKPSAQEVTERLGTDFGGLARRMSENDGFLFKDVIFPHLREAFDQFLAASEDAVAIVAHSIAFAAQAAAEKRGLPLVVVTLSPVLLYSAHDPPFASGLPFVPGPRGRLALAYNRALLGLPARGPFALFHGPAPGVATIALHSPTLLHAEPHQGRHVLVAGHSFHDSNAPMEESEAEALEAFLSQGPVPVVFTLGSFVAHGHEEHYRACMEACAALGVRAVLLAHAEDVARLRAAAPAELHVAPYVPHSLLFPRALVVAHHGGIGTSGQALRAGKPQLVTPFLGDQQDNAARLRRLGVARTLAGRAINPLRLARELRALLETPDYALRARELGAVVSQEDGASAAAHRIAELLRVS